MKMVVHDPLTVFATTADGGMPRVWQVQTDGSLKEVTEEYNRAHIRSHVDSRKHKV